MAGLNSAMQRQRRTVAMGSIFSGGSNVTHPGDPNFSTASTPGSQLQFPAAAAQSRVQDNQQRAQNQLLAAQGAGLDVTSSEYQELLEAARTGTVQRKATLGESLLGWLGMPFETLNLLIQDITTQGRGEGANVSLGDYANALWGGIEDDEAFQEKTGLSPYSFSNTLTMFGWDPAEEFGPEAILRGVVDFGGSMLIDPLTYLTGGLSGLGRRAAVGVGRQVDTKVVSEAMKIIGNGEGFERFSRNVASSALTGADGLSDYTRHLLRNNETILTDFEDIIRANYEDIIKQNPNNPVVKSLMQYLGELGPNGDKVFHNFQELALHHRVTSDVVAPLARRDFNAINPLALQELPLWARGGARIALPSFSPKLANIGMEIPGTRGLGRQLVGDPLREVSSRLKGYSRTYDKLANSLASGRVSFDSYRPILNGLRDGTIQPWQFHISASAIDNIHNQAYRQMTIATLTHYAGQLDEVANTHGVDRDTLNSMLRESLEKSGDEDALLMQANELVDSMQGTAAISPNLNSVGAPDAVSKAVDDAAKFIRKTYDELHTAMAALDPSFKEKYIDGYLSHVYSDDGLNIIRRFVDRGANIPYQDWADAAERGEPGHGLLAQLMNATGAGGRLETDLGSNRWVDRSTGRLQAQLLTDDGVVMLSESLVKNRLLAAAGVRAVGPAGEVATDVLQTRYMGIDKLNELLEPVVRENAEKYGIHLPRNWDGKVFKDNPFEIAAEYTAAMDDTIKQWSMIRAMKQAGLVVPHGIAIDVQDVLQKMMANINRIAHTVQVDSGVDADALVEEILTNPGRYAYHSTTAERAGKIGSLQAGGIYGDRAAAEGFTRHGVDKESIIDDMLLNNWEQDQRTSGPFWYHGSNVENMEEINAGMLSMGSHSSHAFGRYTYIFDSSVADMPPVEGMAAFRQASSAATAKPIAVFDNEGLLSKNGVFDPKNHSRETLKEHLTILSPEQRRVLVFDREAMPPSVRNPLERAGEIGNVRGVPKGVLKPIGTYDPSLGIEASFVPTPKEVSVLKGKQDLVEGIPKSAVGSMSRAGMDAANIGPNRKLYQVIQGMDAKSFNQLREVTDQQLPGTVTSGLNIAVTDARPKVTFVIDPATPKEEVARLREEALRTLDDEFTNGQLKGRLTHDDMIELARSAPNQETSELLYKFFKNKMASLNDSAKEFLGANPGEFVETTVLADDFYEGVNDFITQYSAYRTAQTGELVSGGSQAQLLAGKESQFAKDLKALRKAARELGERGYNEASEVMRRVDDWTGVQDIPGFIRPHDLGIGGPAVEGMAIQRDIGLWIKNVSRNLSSVYTPEGVAAARIATNELLRTWRALATLPRPAFHIRNAIGAAWMNMAVGVQGETYRKLGTNAARWKTALRDGVADPYSVIDEELRGVWKAMVEQDILGGFVTSEFRTAVSSAERNERLGWLNVFDPESFVLTRVGSRAMESIEDVARAALFMEYFDEAVPGSAITAKEVVRSIHFDYNDLTPWETKIKSFVPFFVWTRRNLPRQLEMMIEKPGLVQRYQHLLQTLNDNLGGNDENNLPTGDQFSAHAAGTNIYVNPGTPFWARVIIDPDLPTADLLNIPTLDPGQITEFANGLLGPHVSTLININEQREFGDVNAPAPMNAILKGLAAIGMYDETIDGDVRIPYWLRTVQETALPFTRDIIDPLTGGPTDPNRQQRVGIKEDDNFVESGLKTLLSSLGRGVGVKYSTPVDVRGVTARSQDELDKIIGDLRAQGALPPG